MTTPANAAKEKEKALVREQRERDRLEKEKERMARLEKLQRAQSQPGGSPPARSKPISSSPQGNNDATGNNDDAGSNSDQDAEDAAANKKEYQQKIVQLWKDKAKRPQKPGGVIRFKTTFRNTILDVFRANGWKESESETDWDIFWTNKEWIRGIYDKIHLEAYQRVNHFRNFYELTRKDLLVKNLKRARRTLQKKGKEEGEQAQQQQQSQSTTGGGSSNPTNTQAAAAQAAQAAAAAANAVDPTYDFFPDTYSLPSEYSLFVEAFKRSPGISWIMKPIGSSQGKGIFLFEKLHQISEWKNDLHWKPEDSKAEKYIVQRYLSSPLLIGGKKFDLRIYVLVTSYQPLTCYMYREGFARFSSTRFTMVKGDLTNNYVHLTNVAIQKKGDDYDAESGGKWDVRSLKLYLFGKYGLEKVNTLFTNIQLICIRSLLSVQKVIISDKHSFEMYGYDILIDSDLKPWLIEVNASPSLSANTPKDYQMKLALLHDTIAIVDMEKKLTGLEDQVGGYDLIYRNGFVKFNTNCTFTTYLGCHNNREKQLRRMWKAIKKKQQATAAASASPQQNAPGGTGQTNQQGGGQQSSSSNQTR